MEWNYGTDGVWGIHCHEWTVHLQIHDIDQLQKELKEMHSKINAITE